MPKLITTRTRIADLGKPRIIVIGGGFGGLELVKRLNGKKYQTVLVDRYNHHTFQPLLYQVATSALQPNSILYPFRKRFRDFKNFYFRLAEVTNIVAEENYIETSIGSVKYDYLVIATGSTTNYFGNQSIEKHSLPLKTIEDAISLRNRIIKSFEYALLTDDPDTMNSFMDYVIVGGGPTGVEVAGALAELKKHVFPIDYKELDMKNMDIHLVEASSRLLNGMSDASSAKALKYLKDLGVQVHLNVMLKSYDGLEAVFDKLDPIKTRSLLWAAGVKGNGIKGLRPEVYTPGGRIQVDEYNRIRGYENVFAIGDLAQMESAEFPKGHPMMAPPAIQQAVNLADNIKRLLVKKPIKPFRYSNKGAMATIGRNRAVVEIKGLKAHGVFAWVVWIFVHLMAIVGFKNRFAVFLTWFMSYFSYDKANRVIIGKNFGADYNED